MKKKSQKEKRITWTLQKKKLSELKPHPKNPRQFTEKGMKDLESSIDSIGFAQPINITQEGTILSGHARVLKLQEMGYDEVDVYVPDRTLTPKQEDEIIVRMNANTAGQWDYDKLANEFELPDLTKWGLELPEIEGLEPEETIGDDDVPEEPIKPITIKGDLYELGNHRLLCGDSTMIDEVERLMGGEKADLLHTDPPYNVDYSNADRPKAGKKDLGKIKNDTMDSQSFYDFLFGFYSCAYAVLKDDSTAYIWHASSEQVNFTKALADAGFNYTQQIIWKKPMLLGRGRYQWAHEPCLMGVKGSPYFTDDRTKTTVWDFGGYDKSNNVHPTQKPLVVCLEGINNSSKQGSNVLDLFGGSGSTLIACEKTSRKCFMMELDEKYCDVIVKRYIDFCEKNGKKPVVKRNGEDCLKEFKA